MPVKGKFCQVTASASATEYAAMNWTLNLDGKVVDYSNFKDGRVRVATLDDATVSFQVPYNEEDKPEDNPYNLKVGNAFALRLYVNSSQTVYYNVPVVIETVGVSVAGPEDIAKLDVTAGLHGSVTYPVWT
jgi:hypothetical protein